MDSHLQHDTFHKLICQKSIHLQPLSYPQEEKPEEKQQKYCYNLSQNNYCAMKYAVTIVVISGRN